MDPRLLLAFTTVADVGTVTRAAERLGTVQPAVTRRLQRLQRELGLDLVAREGTGLVLTPAGEAFLPVARRVLAEHEAAAQAAEAFAATFIETLPSGKQNTFAAHSLPELVAVAVRDRRPVSYVTAFEKPVEVDEGHDRRAEAAAALAREASGVQETYGMVPREEWVMAVPALRAQVEGLGEVRSQPELLAAVRDVVTASAAGTPEDRR